SISCEYVNDVSSVVLESWVFVYGTGVMMTRWIAPEPQDKKSQTSASGPKTQAAPPTTGPAESDKGTGTANEIGNVYLTNAALADEKFAGKRVAITGKMQRIRATGASTEKGQVLYDLEMFSGAGDAHHLVFLKFRFTDDDRKQLAKLTVGQVLTIEGKPGRAHRVSKEEREIIIYFEDCKILKVGDWQPNP